MNQRIYITTLDDAPTFDVSSKVSDEFIDEEIRHVLERENQASLIIGERMTWTARGR